MAKFHKTYDAYMANAMKVIDEAEARAQNNDGHDYEKGFWAVGHETQSDGSRVYFVFDPVTPDHKIDALDYRAARAIADCLAANCA